MAPERRGKTSFFNRENRSDGLPFSSQGSRSDDYDNTAHLHRAQTSLPRDFSTRRYNSHGYNQTYRPSVADLVSHYYPADSTLNVLSAEKKRSTAADHLPSAQPRDEVFKYVLPIQGRRTTCFPSFSQWSAGVVCAARKPSRRRETALRKRDQRPANATESTEIRVGRSILCAR